MAEDCIFCKIVAGAIPACKVFEDGDVLAFLDINPLSRGHVLLIPKIHAVNLTQCPPDVLAKLVARIPFLASAIIESVGAEGFNILCNNGRAAGQIIDHVHLHIIPRLSGDGAIAHRPALKLDQAEMQHIAAMIKERATS